MARTQVQEAKAEPCLDSTSCAQTGHLPGRFNYVLYCRKYRSYRKPLQGRTGRERPRGTKNISCPDSHDCCWESSEDWAFFIICFSLSLLCMWMVCGCACAAAVKRTPVWCRLSPRCFAGSLGSKRRSSGLYAMGFLPVSHLMNPPSYCGVGRILLIRWGWLAREL